MAAYVRLEEIETVYLENCGDGLFQSTSAEVFGNIIVTTDGDTRYAIYLNNPKGPSYAAFEKNARGSRTGILWPTPAIEVDPSTQYDYDRRGGAIGDIVVAKGRPAITALSMGRVFDDPSDVPLWGEGREGSAATVGFKGWRLVSVTSDGERRTIYVRSAINAA